MKFTVYDFVIVRDEEEVLIPEIDVFLCYEREDFHLPPYWAFDGYEIKSAGLYRAIGGLSKAELIDLEERATNQAHNLCE